MDTISKTYTNCAFRKANRMRVKIIGNKQQQEHQGRGFCITKCNRKNGTRIKQGNDTINLRAQLKI